MINQIKTVLLLGILTGLLLFVGNIFGGAQGLTIALIFVLIMNGVSYFFSDKIVLMMYKAKEVSKSQEPVLHKMVEDVARAAGIPKPKIYIIPSDASNAFATGRSPKHAVVACTIGIMKLLSKEELRGVIAHEMSHIKNRDILIMTIASVIAGVISYLAQMAQLAAIFGGGRNDRDGGETIKLLALAILTPLIAMILQLAISRSREYLADENGAKIIKDPISLANALGKLHNNVKINPMKIGNNATSNLFILNPFNAKGFLSLLSTHPDINDRIFRLKQMKI